MKAYRLTAIIATIFLAGISFSGCIYMSSSNPPTTTTTCTTTDNGPGVPPTSTCQSQPGGNSFWSFFL